MVPVLFHLGGTPVKTHEFFTAVAFLVGGAVVFFEARRRGRLNLRTAWVAVGVLVGGAIGARMGAVWMAVVNDHPGGLVRAVADGGKSILGGLPGAYIGAVVARRLVREPIPTGDMFAPAVALGMVVGRIGCFLTETVGAPTGLPWGVSVSPEAAARLEQCAGCAAGVPMHPSLLYEIAFHLAALAALVWLRPRVRIDGELLKIYLFGYATFRFWVEFVRGHEEVTLGLTRSQLVLVPVLLLLATYFLRRWRRGTYRWDRPGVVLAAAG